MKLSNYLLSALMTKDDPIKSYTTGAMAAGIPTEVAAKNALLQKTQMEVEGQKAAQDMVKNYDWSKLGEYGPVIKMSVMSGNAGKGVDLLKTTIEKHSDTEKAKLNNFSDILLATMRTLQSPSQLKTAADSIEKTFPGMGQNWPSEEKFKNPDGSYNMEAFNNWKMLGLGSSAYINYLTAQTTSQTKENVAGITGGTKLQSTIIKTESDKERTRMTVEEKGKERERKEQQSKEKQEMTGKGKGKWGNIKRNEGGGEGGGKIFFDKPPTPEEAAKALEKITKSK